MPKTTISNCYTTNTFRNNAVIATPGLSVFVMASGNCFPSDAGAMQFVNYNNGSGRNYAFQATSSYKNEGTDGKDLGADMAGCNPP